MIQCLSCKAMHPLNTLFCNECGEYLGINSKETEVFTVRSPSQVTASVEGDDDLQRVERGTDASGLSTITLIIGQAGHRVSVPLNKEVLLGRLDPVNDNYPDVDLVEYDGLEQGVSRRHARIICQQDEIMIEDLGSVNGSFVNGEQLMPYLAHSLKNEDVLQLGKMRIRIVF